MPKKMTDYEFQNRLTQLRASGLDVYTDSNEYLGKVDDIFPTGSNDVYVVKDSLGKQILLPGISDVIKEIDVENGKITVTLIKGLI